MTSTPPVVGPQLDPRAATTRSTAARLLDGAGRATVVAYRKDAGRPHQVLAHGLTPADVLGAIAGDLPEGHTDEVAEVTRREDGSWLVDGRMSIYRVERLLATAEGYAARVLAGSLPRHDALAALEPDLRARGAR